MVDLERRALLVGAATTVVALRLGATTAAARVRKAPLPADPFTLGVASGDPTVDGFVLWTRLALDPLGGGGMSPEPVAVSWEVAGDSAFSSIVASGAVNAIAELAHTVHVEVGGLASDTPYWYRFTVEGWDSPAGRSRTLAVGSPNALRFGFVSCQNYASGYYTALAALATEECDLWLHLGDYIYEHANGGPTRSHGPDEAVTLEQYRDRYALYKTDPDLQAAHHAAPIIPIWDDHEVDNNYTVVNDARRAAAYRAWVEHLPVRLTAPTGPSLRIYRHFRWGDLAAFHMLDGRQYRDPPPCGGGLANCPERLGEDRTLLGADQQAWLQATLADSNVVWDVVGQPVVFSPMPFGPLFNTDQWDGYPQQRDRVWSMLKKRPNPIVVSGDIHAGGVASLHEILGDVSSTRIGTELVGTSVTSRFDPAFIDAAEAIINALPYVEYGNGRERGYTIVDLTRERMRATYKVVSTIDSHDATVSVAYVAEVDARSEFAPPPTPVAAPASYTG